MTAEELISIYGEQYRTVIEDSLSWIDHKEKEWGISPIDRVAYVSDIISHIHIEGDKECL